MKHLPWKPLALLLLACLASFLIYLNTSNDHSTKIIADITLSLATSFISVIFTVLILDRYLESQRIAEKLNLNHACLRTMRPSIEHIAYIFYSINKATALKKGEAGKQSISTMLKSLDNDQVRCLNCQLSCPHGFPSISWEDYLIERFRKFTDALNRLLERYSVNLDADTIELCEQIANHFFPRSLSFVNDTRAANKELLGLDFSNITTLQLATTHSSTPTVFEDYIDKLSKLTTLVAAAYNAKDLYIDLQWEDRVIPLLGSCRLPDSDIPVDPFRGKDNVRPDMDEVNRF
jgi:hypothetical protein